MVALHIESTAGCPRTPVLLFALEEAEAPYELVLRPDGWFEQNHGQPGPTLTFAGKTEVGLGAVLGFVQTLPALAPTTAADGERAATWFGRIGAVRAAIGRVAGAKRAGGTPADEDLRAIGGLARDLEAELAERPWLGGARLGALDAAAAFVGGLTRLGVPLGPRTVDWLTRLHGREAWARARARFPATAALELPAPK